MGLNLDSIISKSGYSVEELSKNVGIPEDALKMYSSQERVPDQVLLILIEKTGLDAADIDSEYPVIMEKKNDIVKKLGDINSSEILGKIKRSELIEDIQKDVKKGLRQSKQELDEFWTDYFTHSHLIEMLNAKKLYNTPNTRKYINELINEEVNTFVNKNLEEKTNKIFERENALINAYPEIELDSSDISDGQNHEVKNVMGTRIAVPLTRTLQKNAARIVIDFATIGLGEIFFTGKSVIDWKSSLADSIVEKYSFGDVKEKIAKEIENYWKKIRDAVLEHQEELEEAWREKISLLSTIAEEEQYVVLKHKIIQLEESIEE